MHIDDYIRLCANMSGAQLDRPFTGSDTLIARHALSRKWFAALMLDMRPPFVNLKCTPIEGDLLRQSFAGIRPGYHMNKQHWISVSFDSDVPYDLIRQLTIRSYELTQPKRPRSKDLK